MLNKSSLALSSPFDRKTTAEKEMTERGKGAAKPCNSLLVLKQTVSPRQPFCHTRTTRKGEVHACVTVTTSPAWAEKNEGSDSRASFPSAGAPTPEIRVGILLSILTVLSQATWRVLLDQNRGRRGKAMRSGCKCRRMAISASIAAADIRCFWAGGGRWSLDGSAGN